MEVINEKPTFDKTVKGPEDEGYDTDTTASIGDTVEWKLTVGVPSNVDKLNTFKVSDKLSTQLNYVKPDDGSSGVTVKAFSGASVVVLTAGDYQITSEPQNEMSGKNDWANPDIVVDFTETGKTKLAEKNVDKIEITFKTILNATANIGQIGNINDGRLTYSNEIVSGGTPKEDYIEDRAVVYTFNLSVDKVDANSLTPLEGVEFNLYEYNGEGTPTEDVLKASGGLIKITGTNGEYKLALTGGSETLTTNADGEISVNGLGNGKYYLVETKAKEGYNLLKSPVEVKLQVQSETTITTTTTTENGETKTTVTESTVVFDSKADSTGSYEITIENNKGFELPTTGGMGTLLASFAGILLMAGGAFVFLSSRKRKNA